MTEPTVDVTANTGVKKNKMSPSEQFDQILRLQSALDIVTKIGSRRNMKQSDIDALVQSLKHITKKLEKTEKKLLTNTKNSDNIL